MANQDLFKQAIAEAKSVREAAIINAKEALEETLTPHLKELLAAKLQEMDMADDEVNEMEDEMDEMAAKKGNFNAATDAPEDQLEEAEDKEAEDDSEESEDEAEAEEEGEEKAKEEEELEVKDMEVEDLKNLIRDIVAQEMGNQGGEEMPADDMDMDTEPQPEDMMGADDEEINLEELLAELEQLAETANTVDEAKKKHKKEEKEEKEDKKAKEDKTKKDLKEALDTIQTLRSELSEVNLLNAKLLYLNKVFRANNLTESQKVTVITSFDKAVTVNEVKLVYETVKQSFVNNKPKSTIKESKGFASAAAGHSTKPAVIEQVDEQVLRMQKLAGIIR
jgi:hypothetical protein